MDISGINTFKEITCPSCGKSLPADSYFCLYCGAKLKDPPINTSIAKQILIYFISLFLAPFGLGYAVKYMRSSDPDAQKIGMISLTLTILGVIIMIWLGISSINYYNELLKTLTI